MWVTVSRGRIRASPQLATRNFGSQTERCYKSVLASRPAGWIPRNPRQRVARSTARVNKSLRCVNVCSEVGIDGDEWSVESVYSGVANSRIALSELSPNYVARDEGRRKLRGIGKEHSGVPGKRSDRATRPSVPARADARRFRLCEVSDKSRALLDGRCSPR